MRTETSIAPRFPHPLHSGERNTRSEMGIAPAFPFSTSDMAPQAAELSLVAKISASIWQNEAICQEEKYLKKRWFVRNGQDTDKAAGWEKPVMVVVVQNIQKKNVWFGPVIQVAVTPFHTGKGKAKEQRDALSFLVLSKDHGFVSVILDPTEYDMDTLSLIHI